jgi:hypothetical protein
VDQLIEDLTRGNVTEVKVVLATVILALALYQVLLAAIARGWVKLPFLSPAPASWTHRANGHAILVLTTSSSPLCASPFHGFEEGGRTGVARRVRRGATPLRL